MYFKYMFSAHLQNTMKTYQSIATGLLLSIISVATGLFAQEKPVDPKSIYARLGGQPAIDAAVDIFYKKILADDRVNYLFEDINMSAQIRKQKAFLGAAFGGPVAWTGKNMRDAHKHLALTEEHFGAIAGHLASTLKDLKVDEGLAAEIMTLAGSTKDDV
jgi:hemoglobin